ncbi:MAG: DNA polymerase III subunit delta [SAR86 cluster bacterium]|uniref:DNA polymerase III subunit delta n=1 Tax=SAR86 cluster bacterium TaxID=2030880 RepID=A0A937I8Q5_9GAMM|nr:DNA polymerase III subunit delta [SAR86 cluster bacterium]
MISSALEFLRSQEIKNNNFLIFGDEIKLIFYIKNKIKSLHANYERVLISIEDKDFDEQLQAAILSNSLFSEVKIIEFTSNKNRLSRLLVERIQTISSLKTQNILIIELPQISQKLIANELSSSLSDALCTINCTPPTAHQIKEYIALMPENLISKDNLESIVEMYEGNFSLLMNDIEVAKQASLKEKDISSVFFSKAIKNNFKLFEEMQKGNFSAAIKIVDSMKENDKGSGVLLLWMLARDCRAIIELKTGKNSLRHLKIWSNQENFYKEYANKISEIKLNEIILLLDKFDKSIKGVLNYDSWQIAKDLVMQFCRASKKITT